MRGKQKQLDWKNVLDKLINSEFTPVHTISPAYQATVWQHEEAESHELLLDTDLSLYFSTATLYG